MLDIDYEEIKDQLPDDEAAKVEEVQNVLDLGTKSIEAGTIYDAEQAALGDMAGGLGLMVMHSMIFKEYKKMEMVDYDKYVVDGVIQKEITLPTIAGKHVLVTDRFTVTGESSDAVYSTYLFGEGAFLSCDKKNYENQYTTNYDPETSAGVDKFYTKQGKVLHPNGLSLALHGDGRKGGWVYQASKGEFYFTKGKTPNRPMYNAFTALKNKLIKRYADILRSKIGG